MPPPSEHEERQNRESTNPRVNPAGQVKVRALALHAVKGSMHQEDRHEGGKKAQH